MGFTPAQALRTTQVSTFGILVVDTGVDCATPAMSAFRRFRPPVISVRKVLSAEMDQIDRARVEETQGILDLNWITDRIGLGGWLETEEKMRAVAQLGITHIIDMAWEHDDTPTAAKHGIKVLLNTTDDDFQPKGTELLERGVEFARQALQERSAKLLIHCVAGRHRGPMMTLAVLCALGWSMNDAMRHISERRPIVDWSPVYVDSVKAFLQDYNRERPEAAEASSPPPIAA
jgi:protein-tyrosine phosphatase